MPPRFFWPLKPHAISQGWGTYNPAVYSQFGFSRHNGIDHQLPPDKKIFAPCDGTIVRVATKENGQWQPNGGGVFVSLMTGPLEFPAFTNTAPGNVPIRF